MPARWQAASLNGDLGIPVIRGAVSNRLRVELLRAHLPAEFKTPGAQAQLVSGDNNRVLVIGAAERDELVRLRQEALQG